MYFNRGIPDSSLSGKSSVRYESLSASLRLNQSKRASCYVRSLVPRVVVLVSWHRYAVATFIQIFPIIQERASTSTIHFTPVILIHVMTHSIVASLI